MKLKNLKLEKAPTMSETVCTIKTHDGSLQVSKEILMCFGYIYDMFSDMFPGEKPTKAQIMNMDIGTEFDLSTFQNKITTKSLQKIVEWYTYHKDKNTCEAFSYRKKMLPLDKTYNLKRDSKGLLENPKDLYELDSEGNLIDITDHIYFADIDKFVNTPVTENLQEEDDEYPEIVIKELPANYHRVHFVQEKVYNKGKWDYEWVTDIMNNWSSADRNNLIVTAFSIRANLVATLLTQGIATKLECLTNDDIRKELSIC